MVVSPNYAHDVEKREKVTVDLVVLRGYTMTLPLRPNTGEIRNFFSEGSKNMQYRLKIGSFRPSGGLKICKFPPGSDQFSPQKYANFPLTYEGASRGLCCETSDAFSDVTDAPTLS